MQRKILIDLQDASNLKDESRDCYNKGALIIHFVNVNKGLLVTLLLLQLNQLVSLWGWTCTSVGGKDMMVPQTCLVL